MKKLPIGIQAFGKLIQGNYIVEDLITGSFLAG